MKSPIEKRLADELLLGYPGVSLDDCTRCGPASLSVQSDDLRGMHLIVDAVHGHCAGVRRIESDERYFEAVLYSDVRILSYRIDLLLAVNHKYLLAIECDGHEFHERTKQQAAYDRSRDRDLLKMGLATARFTGSEIVHSASRCAFDVWQIAEALGERESFEIRLWIAARDSIRNAKVGDS